MQRKSFVVLVLLLAPGSAFAGVDKVLAKRINLAIHKGVAHLREIQQQDGTWPYPDVAASYLATLALLESGVPKDDPAIQKALVAIRKSLPEQTTTYGVSLAIMLLDRLGDPLDIPIIELMGVRLLEEGQQGRWHYNTPATGEDIIAAHLRARANGLAKPRPKATQPAALPNYVRLAIAQIPPRPIEKFPIEYGDNSNSQFAALALWIARRYGVPGDGVLGALDKLNRGTQHKTGGWSYQPWEAAGRDWNTPTPAMTCSGLVGLAVFHGTRKDVAGRPLAEDPAVKKAVAYLDAYLSKHPRDDSVPDGGNGYYLLWSLERMAMLYGLTKIGDRDWYDWGARIIVAKQNPGGEWEGNYQTTVDTSFALLFLKRSNLAPDLTVLLQGISKNSATTSTAQPNKEGTARKEGANQADSATIQARTEAVRLSTALLDARPADVDELLEKFRQGKGAPYNQSLAATIPQLKPGAQDKARKTLAARLATFAPADLRKEFKALDVEIRRAAVSAASKSKALVPDLIEALGDAEAGVVQAAHQSLRETTGEDFGPAAGASRAERENAIAAWRAWWKKQ